MRRTRTKIDPQMEADLEQKMLAKKLASQRPAEGPYYWIFRSPSWVLKAYPSCDFGGKVEDHVKAWNMEAFILARHYKVSMRDIEDYPYGMPRGRVADMRQNKGCKHDFVVYHGDDSPVSDWKQRVISAFNLRGFNVEFRLDEHEVMDEADIRGLENAGIKWRVRRVAVPTVKTIDSVKIEVRFNDHNPPHFHVRNQNEETASVDGDFNVIAKNPRDKAKMQQALDNIDKTTLKKTKIWVVEYYKILSGHYDDIQRGKHDKESLKRLFNASSNAKGWGIDSFSIRDGSLYVLFDDGAEAVFTSSQIFPEGMRGDWLDVEVDRGMITWPYQDVSPRSLRKLAENKNYKIPKHPESWGPDGVVYDEGE